MTNYLQKIHKLDQELNNDIIHAQTIELTNIIQTISEGNIPKKAPKRLGFLPDEFDEILSIDKKVNRTSLKTINHLFNSLRQYLSLNYGVWSIPNLQTAQLIVNKFSVNNILEVMAGNAYWSKAFKLARAHVIATDSLQWAQTSATGTKRAVTVRNMEAVSALKAYPDVDLVICSWAPNFGYSDQELVNAWQKQSSSSKLLFVGEKEGVTNSIKFWQTNSFVNSDEIKEINRSFKSFDFIDEKIFEIKKYEF